MARRPTSGKTQIAIIGAGTLAATLARALHAAGYRISEIGARENRQSLRRARALAKEVAAEARTIERLELSAPMVWICVPDDAIAAVADQIAKGHAWQEKLAVHSSGALTSDVLVSLRRKRAEVASAHPLMTFVSSSKPNFAGVPFAIEGTRKAIKAVTPIVECLRARPFRIGRKEKPAYHAFGFFSSPAMVTLIAAAQQVGKLAGLDTKRARELMEPIVRQTIDNCFRSSPQQAFSGPVRRGDVETIRKHLRVLHAEPDLLELYRAVVRIALQNLPNLRKKELERILTEHP